MFYLVSKLEMEEINKGMEKLMYFIEHDIHDQDVFSEDQMPVVWETKRKRKECLESLKLDLISFVPVYNCPLTIYIGRDNTYYKYFKYDSFRFHAMQKVNLFYSDQISNEERKKIAISNREDRYFGADNSKLENALDEIFASLNFKEVSVYKISFDGRGFSVETMKT